MVWCSHGVAADEDGRPLKPEPRTVVVALDGTGQYRSIQEAIEHAAQGDTIRVKAGEYQEDVTIHSKEGLRLIGDGMDRVRILGRNRVGTFHIGKWPYGVKDVEVSGLTIHEHGGLAMGIFNGRGLVLRDLRINGMVFAQQVQDVRIEQCVIGGSETTGVQFADSQAVLVGNLIHDNDHGVTIAGKSDVRLERNIITRSLFEGVVVTDSARAALVGNTIVKNGGGVAFLGSSRSEVSGNIVGLNKIGFLVGPASGATFSFNALHNQEGDYLKAGSPNVPAPELKGDSDLAVDPRFVDPGSDDFRLREDSPLTRVGGFAYLGALAPSKGALPVK
ncbi:MAG: right-handed parallel beta-helix repeat-containing protein [Nitrospiraceae bacterium]